MANQAGELIEIELGGKGLEYVRGICGDISGICSRLCRIESKNLTITGLVPQGTSKSRAEQLNAGGLVSPHIAWDWLANQTNELSSKQQPVMLLAQDIWMQATDKYNRLNAPDIERFSYLGCPYHFLNSQPLQVDDVQCLVQSLTSIHTVLAISHYHLELASDESIPAIYDTTFDEVWKRISQIFIDAYDQESFLVLRPKNRNYFGELPYCD